MTFETDSSAPADLQSLEPALALMDQPSYRGAPRALLDPPAIRELIRSRRATRLPAATPLFDAAWYRDHYPDVVPAGTNPAWHCLTLGACERRDPGPGFSTTAHSSLCPDVAESRINALEHCIRFGGREGRHVPPSRDA